METFPDALGKIAVFNLMMRLRGYRSFDEFEQHYPVGTEKPMNGTNYGWYQVRLHVLARQVFDESGETALTRLWALGQSEATRRPSAWVHFREHGTLADWMGRMPEGRLADVLGSKVSPRLGAAIANWPREA